MAGGEAGVERMATTATATATARRETSGESTRVPLSVLVGYCVEHRRVASPAHQ